MRRTGAYAFNDRPTNRSYTSEDDATIMEMIANGETWDAIAAKLGRGHRGVEHRFSQLRKKMGPQAK